MMLASHRHCNQHSPVHVPHHLQGSECLDLDCRVQKGKHLDGDRVTECKRMHFNMHVDFDTNIADLASYLPGTSVLALATNFKTSPANMMIVGPHT